MTWLSRLFKFCNSQHDMIFDSLFAFREFYDSML